MTFTSLATTFGWSAKIFPPDSVQHIAPNSSRTSWFSSAISMPSYGSLPSSAFGLSSNNPVTRLMTCLSLVVCSSPRAPTKGPNELFKTLVDKISNIRRISSIGWFGLSIMRTKSNRIRRQKRRMSASSRTQPRAVRCKSERQSVTLTSGLSSDMFSRLNCTMALTSAVAWARGTKESIRWGATDVV
jgi:hypothetical protein